MRKLPGFRLLICLLALFWPSWTTVSGSPQRREPSEGPTVELAGELLVLVQLFNRGLQRWSSPIDEHFFLRFDPAAFRPAADSPAAVRLRQSLDRVMLQYMDSIPFRDMQFAYYDRETGADDNGDVEYFADSPAHILFHTALALELYAFGLHMFSEVAVGTGDPAQDRQISAILLEVKAQMSELYEKVAVMSVDRNEYYDLITSRDDPDDPPINWFFDFPNMFERLRAEFFPRAEPPGSGAGSGARARSSRRGRMPPLISANFAQLVFAARNEQSRRGQDEALRRARERVLLNNVVRRVSGLSIVETAPRSPTSPARPQDAALRSAKRLSAHGSSPGSSKNSPTKASTSPGASGSVRRPGHRRYRSDLSRRPRERSRRGAGGGTGGETESSDSSSANEAAGGKRASRSKRRTG